MRTSLALYAGGGTRRNWQPRPRGDHFKRRAVSGHVQTQEEIVSSLRKENFIAL
jgi:hypothetical protein